MRSCGLAQAEEAALDGSGTDLRRGDDTESTASTASTAGSGRRRGKCLKETLDAFKPTDVARALRGLLPATPRRIGRCLGGGPAESGPGIEELCFDGTTVFSDDTTDLDDSELFDDFSVDWRTDSIVAAPIEVAPSAEEVAVTAALKMEFEVLEIELEVELAAANPEIWRDPAPRHILACHDPVFHCAGYA